MQRPAPAGQLLARLLNAVTIAAPSFNGRTGASGASYRGSTPWGAAKIITFLGPVYGQTPRLRRRTHICALNPCLGLAPGESLDVWLLAGLRMNAPHFPHLRKHACLRSPRF